MTPATHRRWADSCAKLAMVNSGIELGSYEPIDLFSQPEVHLLVLEGMRNLLAVVVEGTGCEVNWISGASP